jgi:hypothetical protein
MRHIIVTKLNGHKCEVSVEKVKPITGWSSMNTRFLARTPDQGLFFVGYAAPISGRPLTNDNLTQTGDDFRHMTYRFSTCRLA